MENKKSIRGVQITDAIRKGTLEEDIQGQKGKTIHGTH